MMQTDKDALICDLAETYGIFDYRALPVSLLATLSVGLRDNSRIKMKLSGAKISSEILLIASAVDNLAFLAWSKTEDAQNNLNRPKSIVGMLLEEQEASNTNNAVMAFETAEEFETARENILRSIR